MAFSLTPLAREELAAYQLDRSVYLGLLNIYHAEVPAFVTDTRRRLNSMRDGVPHLIVRLNYFGHVYVADFWLEIQVGGSTWFCTKVEIYRN